MSADDENGFVIALMIILAESLTLDSGVCVLRQKVFSLDLKLFKQRSLLRVLWWSQCYTSRNIAIMDNFDDKMMMGRIRRGDTDSREEGGAKEEVEEVSNAQGGQPPLWRHPGQQHQHDHNEEEEADIEIGHIGDLDVHGLQAHLSQKRGIKVI